MEFFKHLKITSHNMYWYAFCKYPDRDFWVRLILYQDQFHFIMTKMMLGFSDSGWLQRSRDVFKVNNLLKLMIQFVWKWSCIGCIKKTIMSLSSLWPKWCLFSVIQPADLRDLGMCPQGEQPLEILCTGCPKKKYTQAYWVAFKNSMT